MDLFHRGLGRGSETPVELTGDEAGRELDDLVYFPPVAPKQEEDRRRLVDKLESLGAPVLVQHLPGERPVETNGVVVYDVLEPVATGNTEILKDLPAGVGVLWPLVTGYTDDAAVWEKALQRLANLGVSWVQGVAAELSPADRRRVVDVAGDHGFEDLFHGQTPSERDFAGAVHRAGLHPFLTRPLPSAPKRLAGNRKVAGALAMIGELWLRLGRLESRGQAFYRAARWVDREGHDLMVLAREGNLGVVSWLDRESRDQVEEIAVNDRSTLLEELYREYLETPGTLD